MTTRTHDNSKQERSLFSGRVFSASAGLGRGLVVALLSLGVLASFRPAIAQTVIDSHREYNVKAVTLYAIGRYVRWPESAFPDEQSPFVIGILGSNPFGNTLQRIANKKTIHGRTILVKEYATIEDCTSPCHILFVTRSVPPDEEMQLLESLQGASFFWSANPPDLPIEEVRSTFMWTTTMFDSN